MQLMSSASRAAPPPLPPPPAPPPLEPAPPPLVLARAWEVRLLQHSSIVGSSTPAWWKDLVDTGISRLGFRGGIGVSDGS
jgi:hypothetical protein